MRYGSVNFRWRHWTGLLLDGMGDDDLAANEEEVEEPQVAARCLHPELVDIVTQIIDVRTPESESKRLQPFQTALSENTLFDLQRVQKLLSGTAPRPGLIELDFPVACRHDVVPLEVFIAYTLLRIAHLLREVKNSEPAQDRREIIVGIAILKIGEAGHRQYPMLESAPDKQEPPQNLEVEGNLPA